MEKRGTHEAGGREHVAADELALLVDAVRDYAIFLLSPTGEIRSWNEGARRIMGYDAAEAVGRNFLIFYDEEQLAARKPQRELEIATAEGRVEDEGWRLRKDGTRFWVSTVITALYSPSGELRGFAKVTRDLTQRREADERLRRSEETFRLLVASVKEYAIFVLDPEGRVATWNAGAQRIKGYAPEEIIGQHFSKFYPEVDVLAGKPAWELEEAQRNGSVEDEGWRIRKDGTQFWANVVITAIHDDKGELRGFTKVTRDVTEKKRAEEVYRALLEQREARLTAEEERRRAEVSYIAAQEANRAKDEFLMTLSHELRTPMTAILGWSRLLPILSPTDDSFPEAVASIARSAQLQARLIDDVLDVSRIVSGKMRLALENFDVTNVIMAAIDSVRPSAQAKSITILTQFDPNLGSIIADPTRIQQIIWNLLANAVKFTPTNGLVEITARRTASRMQVEVRDSGEGIDSQLLPHIFEPFRQAENSTTRSHGGLGLGLSIVRYIAEAHGGIVTATSEGKGHGALFTVMLPIRAVAIEPGEAHTPAGSLFGRRLAEVTILLVDDDRDARHLVHAILQAAGADVIAVESAELALASLSTRRPDLIVSDIAMSEMDGFALAREIRRRPELAGVKIVALSAFPAPKKGADLGDFDAYLTKPIEPAELVDAIVRARSAAA